MTLRGILKACLGLLFLLFTFFRPASLKALLIDDLFQNSIINSATDTGSSVANSLVSGPNGQALQMDYSMGPGNFVVATVDFSTQNFASAGGNSVRFRVKAQGQRNTCEIKFTDSDSTETLRADKLSFKFLTIPDDQWRTMTVVFSSFSLFPDGNSACDLSRVNRMTVGLTTDNSSRGQGTLSLDKLELFKSTFTLIDNFEDQAEPNFFGLTNLNTFSAGGAAAAVSYAAIGADKAFQYAWDNTPAGSFSGFFMNLNTNFQGYSHVSFRVRGNAGGEWVKAKLESRAGSTELFISTYLAGGITTAFQTVNIPLSAFSNVDFSSVSVFTVVTTKDMGSGAGTVWFDDIAFARPTETPGVVRVLDDVDADFNQSGWDIYTHADAALQVSAVGDASVPNASANNRVYQLDYNFTTAPSLPAATPYAVIDRPFQISLASFSGLKFQYRGTGASNNFELKLVDGDNTTWMRKFLLITDTGGAWKQASVPFSQFILSSFGENGDLNLKRIKKIELAISRGGGGSGVFTIDSLEAPESGELVQNQPGRLISRIRVVNNPFSPNGDGIKEEAFFAYTLEAASKVNLKIFSLQGEDLKTVANQDQAAGEQSLSWNGADNSGAKMPNGIYLFRLEAEGVDGRKDALRQIIGVLR